MPLTRSSSRRTGRSNARRQGGFIAVLMLVILVVGSLYLVVSGLSTTAAEAELQRGDVTALALRQAKEALIARAALDRERPGSLPCPDRNNDGIAESPSGTPMKCPTYVGRFPWKTLGLPDLRDAAGERLWYALSEGFTDSDDFVINTDTPGTLTVPGMAPSGGVVAIVFAPGRTLGTQARGGPSGACTWTVDDNCKVANYLEGQNASIDTAYEQTPRCERADCPGGYPINDQLTVITHADLFAIVEPVVAKRIETEIAPQLTTYFQAWGQALYGNPQRGFYPFAAPYDDPGRPTDDYLGVYDKTNGLLPVTADGGGSRVRWNAAPANAPDPAPTLNIPPANLDSGLNCYLDPVFPVCTFNYTCLGPTCPNLPVRFEVWLSNAAASLRIMNPAVLVNPSEWIVNPPPLASSLDKQIDAAALRVSLDATLPQTVGSQTVTIRFPEQSFMPVDLTNPAQPSFWFVRNNWHRQTYYALGNKFHPTATRNLADPCPTTPPDCISVVGGVSKARAVLVLAGRHIEPGTRPPYTILNYFELENRVSTPATTLDTPDYIFEQRPRSNTFNDRLVVVAEQSP